MLDSVDSQNESLRLQIKGKKELIPLLKLEADLKELGVSLSEKERKAIKASLAVQENLHKNLPKKKPSSKPPTAQVEAWNNLWTNAASQIEDVLGGTFEKVIRGGKVSFDDFANSLTNIFAKLASDIAQQLIFQPMIKNIRLGDMGLSQAFASLNLRWNVRRLYKANTNPALFDPAVHYGTELPPSGGFFSNPLVSTATRFAGGIWRKFCCQCPDGGSGPDGKYGRYYWRLFGWYGQRSTLSPR